METTNGPDHDQDLLFILMGAAHLGIFGAAGAMFLGPVQAWALQQGILVKGPQVLWTIGPGGAGFDLGRILIGAALLCLIVFLTIWAGIRRKHRQQEVL